MPSAEERELTVLFLIFIYLLGEKCREQRANAEDKSEEGGKG